MADITLPYTITAGTDMDADEVQGNFAALADDALNKTGDTMEGTLVTLNVEPDADSSRDLGSTTKRWANVWCDAIQGASINSYSTIEADNAVNGTTTASGAETLDVVSGDGIACAVTADTLTITNSLAKVGQASGPLIMGPTGVAYKLASQTQNSGVTETLLWDLTVAANVLKEDGQCLFFEAWGKFAATANTKTVKVKWNGVNILAPTGTTTSNQSFCIRGRIKRLTINTQSIGVQLITGTSTDIASIGGTFNTTGGSANTETGSVSFQITGQSDTASNDIILYQAYMYWSGVTS